MLQNWNSTFFQTDFNLSRIMLAATAEEYPRAWEEKESGGKQRRQTMSVEAGDADGFGWWEAVVI